MNTRQNNKLKMMQAVSSFAEKTPASIITKRSALLLLAAKLAVMIADIAKAENVQATVAKEGGPNKKVAKASLVMDANSIGRGLFAFAGVTSNAGLQEMIKNALERIDRVADNALVLRCNVIADKATEHIGDLAAYGITSELADSLKVKAVNYAALAENFRNDVAIQTTATSNIAKILKEATKFFKEELDPVVYSLIGEDNYVREYRKNREILNLGHRYTQFKGLTVNKATGLELTEVEIEIISKDGELKLKSNDDGKYRVRLDPDTYTLRATHPNFEPFIIENVKIQAGEIKVENFVMRPTK